MDVIVFGLLAAGGAYLWSKKSAPTEQADEQVAECPEGSVQSCDEAGTCICIASTGGSDSGGGGGGGSEDTTTVADTTTDNTFVPVVGLAPGTLVGGKVVVGTAAGNTASKLFGDKVFNRKDGKGTKKKKKANADESVPVRHKPKPEPKDEPKTMTIVGATPIVVVGTPAGNTGTTPPPPAPKPAAVTPSRRDASNRNATAVTFKSVLKTDLSPVRKMAGAAPAAQTPAASTVPKATTRDALKKGLTGLGRFGGLRVREE